VTAHRIVPDHFLGAVCAVCRAQADMISLYARDDNGELLPCPGPPAAVPRDAVLPGTGRLDPDQPPRWPASPPAGEHKRHANGAPR
jgi:hypothetical protein